MTKPLREYDNPHYIWTTRWYAWKEKYFNYVPYHDGTTPQGDKCKDMPRVREVRPGVFRCPSCGKEFATSCAMLVAEGVDLDNL